MGIKVCKFGGTSMADGNIIRSVAKIVNSDEDRRYVVVSAPGKRFSGDIKVTDLLYECSDEAATGMKRSEVFSKIRTRFLSIEKEIGMDIGLEAMLDEIEWNIVSGAGKDYCASRGEYLSGRIMAAVLGVPFVDAADVIQFKADGTLDESTYSLMASVLKKYPRAVIPGFYGKGADGKIKTFSRGGSDITGAIVARAVKASLYENWTDVSGFFACDPRIVPSAKCIKELSYQELRELSYMGANVLHSDSIFPVKAAGIPIRIRNTFRPQDEGTLIVDSDVRNPEGNVVTGIAGKKDFTVILLEKSMMNAEVGFAANVLKVLAVTEFPLNISLRESIPCPWSLRINISKKSVWTIFYRKFGTRCTPIISIRGKAWLSSRRWDTAWRRASVLPDGFSRRFRTQKSTSS